MQIIRWIIIAALSLSTVFAADEWMNFAEPAPIYSVIPYQSGVLMGTAGGLRYWSPERDVMFTSKDGLETSSIYGVASSPAGVFAVSEYGMIARMNDGGNSWRVVNRSFLKNNVRLIPDQVLIVENIMVLAFEDRLSFYNIVQEKSLLTVNRIGSNSLSIQPIKEIAVHGDELFISTGTSLYSRQMQWKDLDSDIRLVDPDSWKLVSKGKEHLGLTWKNDSLKTHKTYGTWLWNNGKESSVALDSSAILIDGKPVKDAALYNEGKSRIRWLIPSGKDYYLVGPSAFFTYSSGKLKDVFPYSAYLLGGTYELAATVDGGVVAATADGRIAYSNGYSWQLPQYVFDGIGNAAEAYNYRMKVLSAANDGYLLYHIWGHRIALYKANGYAPVKFFSPLDDNSCLDEILENYTVAVGATVAPDSSGFLVATSSPGKYGLVYISKNGSITCAKNVGSVSHAGPLKARIDAVTSEWVVYVSTRENFASSDLGGLDEIRFLPPSKTGGRIATVKLTHFDGPGGKTPVDIAVDEKNEVAWMVTSSMIGYLDFQLDTIKSPQSTKGLLGAEYSSIDVDVHGNIWLGTTQQGAYRLSRVNKSFDTLSTMHFNARNGMLDDNVLDLVINPKQGMIWFAHENGVSWYRRNDLREAESFMTDDADVGVKAYPVPFRPKQYPRFTIDNISEGALVSIYNRGGSLIKSFRNDEVLGGRAEWDGTGKNGKLVAPGVYYWTVVDGSKKEKGKFLIIH